MIGLSLFTILSVDIMVQDVTKNLFHAINSGKINAVKDCLSLKNVNSSIDRDETPLHRAARKRYTAIVGLLLEWDANTQAQDDDKRTPLHYAVLQQHEAMVQTILNHSNGAITVQDKDGEIALHQASTPKIASALLGKGSDVSIKNNKGSTPLHTAMFKGSLMAKILFDSGSAMYLTQVSLTTLQSSLSYCPVFWIYALTKQPGLFELDMHTLEALLNQAISNYNKISHPAVYQNEARQTYLNLIASLVAKWVGKTAHLEKTIILESNVNFFNIEQKNYFKKKLIGFLSIDKFAPKLAGLFFNKTTSSAAQLNEAEQIVVNYCLHADFALMLVSLRRARMLCLKNRRTNQNHQLPFEIMQAIWLTAEDPKTLLSQLPLYSLYAAQDLQGAYSRLFQIGYSLQQSTQQALEQLSQDRQQVYSEKADTLVNTFDKSSVELPIRSRSSFSFRNDSN